MVLHGHPGRVTSEKKFRWKVLGFDSPAEIACTPPKKLTAKNSDCFPKENQTRQLRSDLISAKLPAIFFHCSPKKIGSARLLRSHLMPEKLPEKISH